MKSNLVSPLSKSCGKLALAMACTLIVGQAAAVPYASMIRFGEPVLAGPVINVDLNYTLNEDADTVTVEVFNNTTASVVRTYVFNSPAVETTRGRHTIPWDGLDDLNNPVTVGGNEYSIRVRVQKLDESSDWTPVTGNGSGIRATEQTSLFGGYSPMDIKIPTDPSSNQFGLLLVSHAWTGSYPAGIVLLGADLAPILGDGGGFDNMKGQHPASVDGPPPVEDPPLPHPINNQALWKMNFDPLNPDLLWWGGQSADAKLGVVDVSPLDPADIQTVTDVAWDDTPSPRGIAIRNEAGTRVGYVPYLSQIDRLTLDAAFPHEVTASEAITDIDRYAQEVAVDDDGNLYFLSRLPLDDSRMWRWDAADVDAAPGTLLNASNAAWEVEFPAGTTHGNTLHIAPDGNVYVGANTGDPRGIFLVGNTADATLPNNPHVLTAGDLVLDFDDPAQFPDGYSTSTLGNAVAVDWQNNMYVTTRAAEEIHSFSPPGNDTDYDITTESPDTLTDDLLLITLDSFTATSAGVGSPVVIEWSTASEIDNAGFNVERVQFSGGSSSPAGRVNAILIPAAGDSNGAEYSLVDSQVLADGEDRGYVLVDIDANGTQTTHGPIKVQVNATDPAGEPAWSLY